MKCSNRHCALRRTTHMWWVFFDLFTELSLYLWVMVWSPFLLKWWWLRREELNGGGAIGLMSTRYSTYGAPCPQHYTYGRCKTVKFTHDLFHMSAIDTHYLKIKWDRFRREIFTLPERLNKVPLCERKCSKTHRWT